MLSTIFSPSKLTSRFQLIQNQENSLISPSMLKVQRR